MALVLLPCDLPTWPRVQRYLNELKTAQTSEIVVDGMLKLHNLCCISLDSDEDSSTDASRFCVFQHFLDSVLIDDDRRKFFEIILPGIVESALQLKALKPPNGIHFSLQQLAEEFSLDRKLVRSLLAHAFLSTFPKRSSKTHPTLQNFNFSEFFIHLNNVSQQAKLRSFFRYFEITENEEYKGSITFSRKVNLDWKCQSLDDPWLTSNLPLCPLVVHHEGSIEDMKNEDVFQTCFSSPQLGGTVLIDGCDQEEVTFATCPELLVCLLCVESLECNETLLTHNCMRVGLIQDGRKFSSLDKPLDTCDSHMCLLDAGDFSTRLVSQFEEKNVLRELLKCNLGFCQPQLARRLSPLGESCGTPPPEMWYSVCGALENPEPIKPERPKLIGQSFASFGEVKSLLSPTKRKLVSQESEYQDAVSYPWEKQKSDENEIWLTPLEHSRNLSSEVSKSQPTDGLKNTTGKISKKLSNQSADSLLSDEEEYESCEEEEQSEPPTPLSQGPVASTGRLTLLKNPIPTVKRSSSSQSEGDELVNVDCSLRRSSSTGFLLSEDDFFVGDGLQVEQEWLRQFRNRSMSRSVSGISRRNSSRYSFSSDFSSDLDEIYEHFEEMMAKGPVSEDPAVAKYAGGLLKRTLSDSLTAARHGTIGEMMPRSLSLADHVTQEKSMDSGGDGTAEKTGKRKLSANLSWSPGDDSIGGCNDPTTACSSPGQKEGNFNLNLPELVPKLQVIDEVPQEDVLSPRSNKAGFNFSKDDEGLVVRKDVCKTTLVESKIEIPVCANGFKPIATGNWGCGRLKGDPQLKAAIQWLAASQAELPYLVYFTQRNQQVVKLDIVSRVLLDRHWTVGTLMKVLLKYCKDKLEDSTTTSLFDVILPRENY